MVRLVLLLALALLGCATGLGDGASDCSSDRLTDSQRERCEWLRFTQ
jgi:hypothetical protein